MAKEEKAVKAEATPALPAGTLEISAKTGDGKEGVMTFDFGKDCDTAIQMFGKEVVHNYFVAHSKVVLQSNMRRYLSAGKDLAGLSTTWKPGVKLETIVDPVAAVKKAFSSMDDKAKAAFLKQLQGM